LRFRERLLVISANAEDDSIDLSLTTIGDSDEKGGPALNQRRPWNEVIGRSFGWGWITVNQQGYCDGILISFGGIVPTLAINVAASSLQVGRIDFDQAPASE
jgi:hypothetical protein